MKQENTHMQRREFITTWIRYLLMALLGMVSIVALVKSQNPENEDCIAERLCNTCGKASSCNLPQKK
jgi:hypothetical protein